MKSIRDLYKVGKGPSSSHTMGPERAARIFKQENPDAERYEVTLYGSLALTGVGHGTDRVLSEVLAPTPTEIIFSQKDPGDLRHPNTLDFAAYKGEEKFASMRVESIGGGDIVIEGRESSEPDDVYPENSFAEIAQYCRWRYISLREYVELNEGAEIWDFLQTIWHTMRAEVEEGLEATGILPGGLNVQRKARYLYERQHAQEIPQVRELQLVCAYAFAAAEQNAANGTIVTAPTCGSCGVLPAVLMYLQGKYHYSDLRMAHALGVAGIIGNLIRRNASISGAECGCQAEIGSACSMAAAAMCELMEFPIEQAVPISAWQPHSAPEIEALCRTRLPNRPATPSASAILRSGRSYFCCIYMSTAGSTPQLPQVGAVTMVPFPAFCSATAKA